jgi:hypothetical protein
MRPLGFNAGPKYFLSSIMTPSHILFCKHGWAGIELPIRLLSATLIVDLFEFNFACSENRHSLIFTQLALLNSHLLLRGT